MACLKEHKFPFEELDIEKLPEAIVANLGVKEAIKKNPEDFGFEVFGCRQCETIIVAVCDPKLF